MAGKYSAIIGVTLVLGGASALAADLEITQKELVRRTQELYDAVVPGKQEPWKKYFADDCIFFDEKGRQMHKAALLADLTPMPKGFSGTIKVVRPMSRIAGDAAVMTYDNEEIVWEEKKP